MWCKRADRATHGHPTMLYHCISKPHIYIGAPKTMHVCLCGKTQGMECGVKERIELHMDIQQCELILYTVHDIKNLPH